MKKIIFVLVAGSLLSGCVTQKPSLAENQYTAFATLLTGIHKCVVTGYVTPEVGARAQSYAEGNLNTYQFNLEVLKSRVTQVADNVNPSQGDCNTLAMQVAQRKNQIDANNEQVAREAQAWKDLSNSQNQNKTTYCNKIGTQTICNSY